MSKRFGGLQITRPYQHLDEHSNSEDGGERDYSDVHHG